MRIEFFCLFFDLRFIECKRQGKCIASEPDLRNKPIATDRPRSVVITIFANHSTLISSITIILKSNDRATSRAFSQEMTMKRREFLQFSFGTAAVAALSTYAKAEAAPKEIRIGTQKGGFFPAVKARQTLEKTFTPLGIDVKWIDFQFGPPLLEAINVGSVDFGYVGDSPPIFAQAAGARIRYVAAVKSAGTTQAIIVPKDSPITTLADLRGKRVAFGKGSSAHNLLVAALEKAGLTWSDITPAPLAPADATAAFVKGSVDAWSIWDPYLASAELKEHAHVIAFDRDVHKANAFYIASADLVEKYPAIVARLNAVFAAEGVWADQHHEEVASAQAEATGVDIEAIRRFVDRSNYRVVPIDDEIVRSQQAVADRFARLNLIPKPINVPEIVWKWTPGA
jgi:sulfonate transport system substrate-binding protein